MKYILILGLLVGCSAGPVLEQDGACEPAPSTECDVLGERCTTLWEGRNGLCVTGDKVDGFGRCELVCCAGCMLDGMCVPGTDDHACGFAGNDCQPCAAPTSCNWEGICKTQ